VAKSSWRSWAQLGKAVPRSKTKLVQIGKAFSLPKSYDCKELDESKNKKSRNQGKEEAQFNPVGLEFIRCAILIQQIVVNCAA
jgi:hypothetical protein